MNRWCGETHWSQASLGVYDRYLLRWFNGEKAAVHWTRGSKHVILSPNMTLCGIFTRVYESIMCMFALERKKSDFSLDTGISITVVCFIIMPGSTDSQYDCANSQRIRTMQHMSTNWNVSLIREASFKITLSLSPHFPVVLFPRCKSEVPIFPLCARQYVNEIVSNMATFTIDLSHKMYKTQLNMITEYEKHIMNADWYNEGKFV